MSRAQNMKGTHSSPSENFISPDLTNDTVHWWEAATESAGGVIDHKPNFFYSSTVECTND